MMVREPTPDEVLRVVQDRLEAMIMRIQAVQRDLARGWTDPEAMQRYLDEVEEDLWDALEDVREWTGLPLRGLVK